MHTPIGQLTFCTNIFSGETWEEHFTALKKYIPSIKKKISPDKPFGIGLRLSNKASLQLSKEETLQEFKKWLLQNDCYVFTMNGFPYGNFHRSRVKDQVHAPDWATNDRLQYSLRLFRILAALLPKENTDGGVSTSPLSYKHWFDNDEQHAASVIDKSTWNMIQLTGQLHRIHQSTGKMLHLDIEPEADGMIENSDEFIDWYLHKLLPLGRPVLHDQFSLSEEAAEKAIKDHVRLCYDVCHFAVGFEDVDEVLHKLSQAGIRIGKWQLSAALKINLSEKNEHKQQLIRELQKFDEPVYLHQVVANQTDAALLRYPDLSDALNDPKALRAEEWRSHFHVPVFIKKYGLLLSTQAEVIKALHLQKEKKITNHLEVETYTWDVLPPNLKIPIDESIVREMKWVMGQIT